MIAADGGHAYETKSGRVPWNPAAPKKPGYVYSPVHGGTIDCNLFYHDYKTGRPFCVGLTEALCLTEWDAGACKFRMRRDGSAWEGQ